MLPPPADLADDPAPVDDALYAMESRAGLLALTDRHAAAPAACQGLVAAAERDYLTALRAGEPLPTAPRIQHLERSADNWAPQVPDPPAVRAELARTLTSEHRARVRDVPRLRRAVGFEDPEVVAEHVRRYGVTPDAGWATELPVADRMRWWSSRLTARLEGLAPFWSAFALTLTQTVGAGILALPIALAGVGPLPGLVLLVLLGLVNVVTVAAVAESVTRTGTVRWGGAYLGSVVRLHLGRYASVVTALALVAFAVASLTAYYIGLASTLERTLGLPATVWVAALFVTTVGFVRRGRMNATIVSALVVGAVNLLLVALLVVAALTALEPDRLTRVELTDGTGGFDPSILGLVFGVVLMAYFGHTSVAAGARDILRRDPGGRGLVRGTAAAMLTVILMYAAWTLAVAGAVDGAQLAGERGTALEPLAAAVGPVVLVLGTLFAITAMGMAAVHSSVGLHAQAVELLSGRGRSGRLPALLPLVAVFVLVETLLLTGRASFTAALGIVGTLAVPVVAGVVPVLLLASVRRRGDQVPTASSRRAGSRPARGRAAELTLLGVVWLVFVAAVAAHGLVIWTDPAARMSAALTVVVIVSMTVVVLRSEALHPLTTLEVRRDRDRGLSTVHLTTGGRPGVATLTTCAHGNATCHDLVGEARLPELTSEATVRVPTAPTSHLRVWVHEVDPLGSSCAFDAAVLVDGDPVPLVVDSAFLELGQDRADIPVTVSLLLPRPV